MTVIQLFGHDTSIVSEANFELVFGGLHEGVFVGVNDECRVNATAPATAQVRAEIGTFVTGGVFARVSAAELKTIPANVSGQDRIDRIICKRDNAADLTTVEVLQGTPAGAPVPPALTRAGDDYEISLAQIYVANGFVTIVAEDILDERENPLICGYSSGKGREQIEREWIEGWRPWGIWQAAGAGPSIFGSGIWSNPAVVDDTDAGVTDADGYALQVNTSNVPNNEASISGAAAWTRRDYHVVMEFKFKLTSIADIRFWAGLRSVQTGGATAEDPAGHYAGLQFSTGPRADVNFQFMTKDNVAQNIIDSGVPVDTDVHYLRVSMNTAETEVLIELMDIAHVQQASVVFTANLPGLAIALFHQLELRTLAAAVKGIIFYATRGIYRGI